MSPAPRPTRRGHSGESGLTLIELLVTISILGVGFLSMLAGFDQVERAVGSTADAAQLASQARQVGDVVESEGFAYVQCASAATYQAALKADVNVVLPTGYTALIITVSQATGGTDNTGPLTPVNACSGNPDYGVQQIQLQITSPANHILVRTVYKRWN